MATTAQRGSAEDAVGCNPCGQSSRAFAGLEFQAVAAESAPTEAPLSANEVLIEETEGLPGQLDRRIILETQKKCLDAVEVGRMGWGWLGAMGWLRDWRRETADEEGRRVRYAGGTVGGEVS
eukprot:Skav202229  [mRNA]  locus=scaffold2988:59736:61690:+ [translate_table: standard]